KEYIVKLLKNDFNTYYPDKHTYETILSLRPKNMIGIGFQDNFKNDTKHRFRDRKFSISFTFTFFEEIEIPTYYKYVHKNNIGWKPINRNIKELSFKYSEVL